MHVRNRKEVVTRKVREERRSRRRWLAGAAWLAGWTFVLWIVAAPWRSLGGLVDERLRWLEYVGLFSALSVGLTVGGLGRDAAEGNPGWTHARFLRRALYPAGATTAVALAVLQVLGLRDAAGVAVTALLAYWAGLDLSFGALPLMAGRSYRFDRPLDPPTLDARPRGRETSWIPPWERF